jgi:hypothetical protein
MKTAIQSRLLDVAERPVPAAAPPVGAEDAEAEAERQAPAAELRRLRVGAAAVANVPGPPPRQLLVV